MREQFRRVAFSYSLSTLYLLNTVLYLPAFKVAYDNYITPSSPEVVWAALLDILVLGSMIFAAVSWSASLGSTRVWLRRALEGLMVLSLVLPANHLFRIVLEPKLGEQAESLCWWAIRLTIVAAALAVIFSRGRRLYRMVVGAVLLVSPLFPLAIVQSGLWLLMQSPAEMANRHGKTPDRRVVWIVLDEWDARATEEGIRRNDVPMPEFNRLRRESLFAPDAYPSGAYTLISLPALITGRQVTAVRPRASFTKAELLLRIEKSSEWQLWGDQWNVFSAVRNAGGNAAVSGFFHSYCQVFIKDLADCLAAGYTRGALLGADGTILSSMKVLALEAALRLPLAARTGWFPDGEHLIRSAHFQLLRKVLERALVQVADPQFAFVLAHLPVPHPPGMYDRRLKRFSANGTYYDNLALADSTLGQLRRSMQNAGTWDKSAVIVTSDHSWRHPDNRGQDVRVPLIIKPPKWTSGGLEYQAPVSTLLLGDLTVKLLEGRINTLNDVAAFLSSRQIPIDREQLLMKNHESREIE